MSTRYCVFAGSSPSSRPEYLGAARELGHELAKRSIDLIYGGASVGLMGALADAALEGGGHVIAVIPQALVAKEVAHPCVPDLRVVSSMHERKALMAELASGFIALPGGLGTLEELLEVLTWAQLGVHAKPCGVLNTCGYFDSLLALLDRAVSERFLRPEHRSMLVVESEPPALLDRLRSQVVPKIDKWLDRAAT
jgi:hypothetical protein